jgi:hypothetical protein
MTIFILSNKKKMIIIRRRLKTSAFAEAMAGQDGGTGENTRRR